MQMLVENDARHGAGHQQHHRQQNMATYITTL
jgi:hypothetical protein